MHAANAHADVGFQAGEADPAGRGRTRTFKQTERSPRHISGVVSWGGEGWKGSVTLRSPNRPATLQL